jgi:hypothetical protein
MLIDYTYSVSRKYGARRVPTDLLRLQPNVYAYHYKSSYDEHCSARASTSRQFVKYTNMLTDASVTTVLAIQRLVPHIEGSISTPLGRTRNCLWQLLVETLYLSTV